ncbi:hypothetical protein FF38_10774 [Lucilia cuprina]|uniref:Uncharacterized protein n=1 Tax=Lucilia cuprina TaxID=7375 RepID=A0A0L0C4B5_LUCCU|nr:hypothetical protein FF38_10774 [Lucilia cuprina]
MYNRTTFILKHSSTSLTCCGFDLKTKEKLFKLQLISINVLEHLKPTSWEGRYRRLETSNYNLDYRSIYMIIDQSIVLTIDQSVISVIFLWRRALDMVWNLQDITKLDYNSHRLNISSWFLLLLRLEVEKSHDGP